MKESRATVIIVRELTEADFLWLASRGNAGMMFLAFIIPFGDMPKIRVLAPLFGHPDNANDYHAGALGHILGANN